MELCDAIKTPDGLDLEKRAMHFKLPDMFLSLKYMTEQERKIYKNILWFIWIITTVNYSRQFLNVRTQNKRLGSYKT